jgi:hypothetical protein
MKRWQLPQAVITAPIRMEGCRAAYHNLADRNSNGERQSHSIGAVSRNPGNLQLRRGHLTEPGFCFQTDHIG